MGDAFYATYFLLSELVQRGVDGVFEQYGARRRSIDFSVGEKLGERDHLIVLHKPKKPDWMRQADYEQAPESLQVRELHTGRKTLVTTLCCPGTLRSPPSRRCIAGAGTWSWTYATSRPRSAWRC